jgi:hypothetical protein
MLRGYYYLKYNYRPILVITRGISLTLLAASRTAFNISARIDKKKKLLKR